MLDVAGRNVEQATRWTTGQSCGLRTQNCRGTAERKRRFLRTAGNDVSGRSCVLMSEPVMSEATEACQTLPESCHVIRSFAVVDSNVQTTH